MNYQKELYQEVILDHHQHPRNFGQLSHPSHTAEGDNPLCGDHITLYLKIENDRITDIKFSGAGCAISTASASLLTEALLGKTACEARQLFDNVHHALVSKEGSLSDNTLGKLVVLLGVRDYPMRIKCATLAWHTLQAALQSSSSSMVCTE